MYMYVWMCVCAYVCARVRAPACVRLTKNISVAPSPLWCALALFAVTVSKYRSHPTDSRGEGSTTPCSCDLRHPSAILFFVALQAPMYVNKLRFYMYPQRIHTCVLTSVRNARVSFLLSLYIFFIFNFALVSSYYRRDTTFRNSGSSVLYPVSR